MIVSQKKIAGSERALYFYSTVVFFKGKKQMYICPYYPRLASKGSKHKYLSVLVGRLKDLDVSIYPQRGEKYECGFENVL